MSDLLSFFGNNEDEAVLDFSKVLKSESNNITKKSAKRPNTLKAQINDSYNGLRGRHQNSFTLTPGFTTDNFFKESPCFFSPMLTSKSCFNLLNLPNELPPEDAKGNVEYKRQLLNLTPLRQQHLISQLKWRLAEGQGEAIYEIGVEDDGTVSGLEQQELNESVTNLYSMAETLHASVSLLRECNIGTKKAWEILIRTMPTHYSAHETRVAVLGNMDAGKSTLIGVLTHGVLDDGRGKTRLSTFRHMHEVRSGRTSSINCQLLGFNNEHEVTNYYWQKDRLHQLGHEDVALQSTRLVSLIDLAGCWKYQRTTLFALTSRRPHYVLLVISATNHELKGTTIHHFQVSEALKLPIAVVITKTDRCSPNKAIDELSLWLQTRSPNFTIKVITTIYAAQQAARQMNSRSTTTTTTTTIPIFPASCVTGQGIEVVTAFLDAFQTVAERCGPRKIEGANRAEVWIDQMHCEVPRVDGCIVVGLVHNGSVYENDRMYLGPQKDGTFVPVSVHSIHRNRLQHHKAHTSQFASFAVTVAEPFPAKNDNSENQLSFKWFPPTADVSINETEYPVQRGMVLLGKEPVGTGDYFIGQCGHKGALCLGHVVWGVVVADIVLWDNAESSISDQEIQPGSWIVHCGNVYQRCDMIGSASLMNHDLIRNLLSKKVIFRFNNFPQFIHCNDTVVFHRPHKHMKANGSIKLLLGKLAFQTSQRGDSAHINGHCKPPITELNLLANGRTGNYYDSDDSEEGENMSSDDDYVTAPSSPIMFQ